MKLKFRIIAIFGTQNLPEGHVLVINKYNPYHLRWTEDWKFDNTLNSCVKYQVKKL